jgi:hypothetical protein
MFRNGSWTFWIFFAEVFNTFRSRVRIQAYTVFVISPIVCVSEFWISYLTHTKRHYINQSKRYVSKAGGWWLHTDGDLLIQIQCLTTDCTTRVRSPPGAKNFSYSLFVQTGSEAQPVFIQWVSGVRPSGIKRGQGVTSTAHPDLAPRSRTSL